MVGHTNGANTFHPLYFVSQHECYIFGYYVRAFNLLLINAWKIKPY